MKASGKHCEGDAPCLMLDMKGSRWKGTECVLEEPRDTLMVTGSEKQKLPDSPRGNELQ